MFRNVLSEEQIEILLNLPEELCNNFVLGGGTALAAFHLQHRKSDDLDFFSKNEGDFSFAYIENILKKKFKIENFDKIFDRKIFFIKSVKIEFIPLYFNRIEQPEKSGELNILYENLVDLASNKIIAMTDREEIKDFIDLYFICKEKNYRFLDVVNFAKEKYKTNYEYMLNFDNLNNLKEDFESIEFLKQCNFKELENFFSEAIEELKNYGINKICEKLENYTT